ncbi:MAG: hypothetical protein ACLQG5_06385 [Methanobacterium sp.]
MEGNPICQKCFRRIVLGYSVKDELWSNLPKNWDSRSVLCLECFIEELDKTHPTLKITLNDFYFLSIIGDYDHEEFGGTILSSDYRKNRRIYLD